MNLICKNIIKNIIKELLFFMQDKCVWNMQNLIEVPARCAKISLLKIQFEWVSDKHKMIVTIMII